MLYDQLMSAGCINIVVGDSAINQVNNLIQNFCLSQVAVIRLRPQGLEMEDKDNNMQFSGYSAQFYLKKIKNILQMREYMYKRNCQMEDHKGQIKPIVLVLDKGCEVFIHSKEVQDLFLSVRFHGIILFCVLPAISVLKPRLMENVTNLFVKQMSNSGKRQRPEEQNEDQEQNLDHLSKINKIS